MRLPHGLERVIEFVNTVEPETGTDAIATPQALRAWLRRRGLLAPSAPVPDPAAYARAIATREALRALMLANNAAPLDEQAAREVDSAARRGELAVRFAADGSVVVAPVARGYDGALAALLVPVALSALDGSWLRVKACREPGCHEAFYDHSRNRSGVWCDMALCGNRTKVRSYRARARGR